MRPRALLATLLTTGLAATVITASMSAPRIDSPLGCLPTDLELPQEPPAPTPSA